MRDMRSHSTQLSH